MNPPSWNSDLWEGRCLVGYGVSELGGGDRYPGALMTKERIMLGWCCYLCQHAPEKQGQSLCQEEINDPTKALQKHGEICSEIDSTVLDKGEYNIIVGQTKIIDMWAPTINFGFNVLAHLTVYMIMWLKLGLKDGLPLKVLWCKDFWHK